MKYQDSLVRAANNVSNSPSRASKVFQTRLVSAVFALSVLSCVNLMGVDILRLPVVSVTASADDGNGPTNTLDGSLATRWSAGGTGQWIRFNLGAQVTVTAVKIACYNGDQRVTTFDIQTSYTGTNWTTVFSGASSGTTTNLESYDVIDSVGQYVRVVGRGNVGTNSIGLTEVEIYGSQQGFSITSEVLRGSLVRLNWDGVTNASYQVQVSSNLATWVAIGPAITNAAPTQTWQDDISQMPAAAWPARYYRVQRLLRPDDPPPVHKLPSEVLNLTNWKMTLPVNTAHSGSPDEYLQPELNGFEDTNYFRVNGTSDGVTFTAPCGGATTGGSSYPRSELREMMNNGTNLASWATTSGTNTMEIIQAITHLPVAKPHLVAGQIHGPSDDVMVFRLEGTKLFVDENGHTGSILNTNYHLGDVFTVKFVAQDGGVKCYYNGQYIYTYAVRASGCYFKAGCYTQSNTSKGDAPTAYGQVVIYNVSVTHQPPLP